MKIIKTQASVPTKFCILMLAYCLSIFEVYIPKTPVQGRIEAKSDEIAKALGV